jgi:hypothetical protein
MSEVQSIQMSGVGGIRNIAKYHDVLRDAVSAGVDFALNLVDMEEVDLSFIQLIFAARRSAEARGLLITLSHPAPEPILKTLERGGFIGPAPDDRRQFWLAQ